LSILDVKSQIVNNLAADHPHGGGRGKSKGNVNPVSPWGMPVSLEICFLLFLND
jgi:ribosomal protein L2